MLNKRDKRPSIFKGHDQKFMKKEDVEDEKAYDSAKSMEPFLY
jgi:hypothetical protein